MFFHERPILGARGGQCSTTDELIVTEAKRAKSLFVDVIPICSIITNDAIRPPRDKRGRVCMGATYFGQFRLWPDIVGFSGTRSN